MIAPALRLLCAAALVAACAPAWSQGVTNRTVVLGQSAPLSGPQRSLGEEVRNGALAYLRRLNDAGGVHGRRIELATLDDAGDAGRALANTRRFIEEFGVFALLAYPERSASPEVLELAHKARMPLFAPVSGASRMRQPGRSVFTVRAGYAQELDQIVDYYGALGLKRLALVRSDDADGARSAAAARAALAKRNQPPLADVVLGAAGAPAAARQALGAAAEVVVLALSQPPAADVVRALRVGGSGAQIIATSLADAGSLARALGAEGAGVSLSQVVPPLEQISLPVVAEYRLAYAAETGQQDFSAASLEAFIAAKVLAEAMRRAGPALTRAQLLLALDAMSAHDTGGHLVHYSRSSRQGSGRIYLLAIGRDGALLY
jgi:ABC-type branched-subunit amino acid transport system substrate-binding protein